MVCLGLGYEHWSGNAKNCKRKKIAEFHTRES